MLRDLGTPSVLTVFINWLPPTTYGWRKSTTCNRPTFCMTTSSRARRLVETGTVQRKSSSRVTTGSSRRSRRLVCEDEVELVSLQVSSGRS